MNTVILANTKYEWIFLTFYEKMMRIPISCAVVLSSYKMVAVFCLRVGTVSSSFSIISVEQKKNKTEKRILG